MHDLVLTIVMNIIVAVTFFAAFWPIDYLFLLCSYYSLATYLFSTSTSCACIEG